MNYGCIKYMTKAKASLRSYPQSPLCLFILQKRVFLRKHVSIILVPWSDDRVMKARLSRKYIVPEKHWWGSEVGFSCCCCGTAMKDWHCKWCKPITPIGSSHWLALQRKTWQLHYTSAWWQSDYGIFWFRTDRVNRTHHLSFRRFACHIWSKRIYRMGSYILCLHQRKTCAFPLPCSMQGKHW